MTDKENPEEIVQLDSSKHGDSPRPINDQNQPGASNVTDNQQQLTNNNSTSPSSSKEQNSTLTNIANSLKLGQKNAQFTAILKEVMRVKLDDDVLTEMKNRYIRPENCECLESTQVNHLIWDKLKHETRSSDLKLQRIQTNLLKGNYPYCLSS